MEFLIKHMVVDEGMLRSHVAHYRESKRSQQKAWAVKYVEVIFPDFPNCFWIE